MIDRIISCDQGSDEWFQHRLGSIGGSGIKSLMTGGQGKTRKSYMYQLVSEIMTQEPYQMKQTDAMKRGSDLEEEARAAFEFVSELEVRQVGLVKGAWEGTHCSPDGMMGDEILEVKCPLAHTQVKYLDENRLPLEYKWQVQWNLYICKARVCHFFSYHPSLKSLWIKVRPDSKLQKEMIEGVKSFKKEMTKLIRRIS